jgi:subtilisin family serine protease
MNTRLKRQVEQVLDEDGSSALEVLVQMQSLDRNVADALRDATRAVGERPAIVSARDLLPPGFKRTMDRTQSAGPLGTGPRRSKASAASHTTEPDDEVNSGIDRLKQWASTRPRGNPRSTSLQPLTASGTALLRLGRDDLQRLGSEVPGVVAVYHNRRVSIPPVSKARSLPPVVTDNLRHVWGVSRTGAMACWGAFDARGAGIKVAVLDTGVEAKHPDLDGKVKDFAEFDANGRIVKRGVGAAYDSDMHGTHVAGTIVGGRASQRWIGMAPKAEIIAGLVLKRGEGTAAQVLAGMQWALDSGAHVISMSFGSLQLSPVVAEGLYDSMMVAAYRKGVPVVVAVGNEGAQTTSEPGNHFLAFTVGATDVDDRAAGFSGGRTQIVTRSGLVDGRRLPLVYSKPDVTAPGVDVYSATPNGKWAVLSGSSMATPHVSGAMALLLSCLPRLSELSGPKRVDVLNALLTSSVKELGESGQNHRFGYGRIDVLRACGFGIELGY